MKLIELRLDNFRQFAGEHVLQIAPDGERNVSVVFGANGSGKTTLLNAFTWCLYEELSSDFMFPERLINDAVWTELPVGDTAQAAVTLEFEHNGEQFTLRRTVQSAKLEMTTSQRPFVESRLVRRSPAGVIEVPNPRDFVNNVLPSRLNHFFFLNGERFEHLLKSDAFEDIESAIKTILGIELIERGIAHLKGPNGVEAKLNRESKRLENGETEQILEQIQAAKDRLVEIGEAQAANAKKQRAQREEMKRLELRLRELEGSKKLQEERDLLERTRNTQIEARNRSMTARTQLLGERGFLPFASKAAQQALDRFDDMREKREIPRPIKLQFVEDLLQTGVCVCGTDVGTPGPARTELESWRSRAGRPDLEENWNRLGMRVASWLSDDVGQLTSRLDEYNEDLAQIAISLNETEMRLSEVSGQLEEADQEDIRQLEIRRRAAGEALDVLLKESWSFEEDEKSVTRDLAKAEIAFRDAEAASAEAEVARRRLVAAEDVRIALEKMLALRTEDVRQDLDSRIKDVYSRVVKKQQVPAVSESFDLLLQEESGGRLIPKAMSTGEAQVLTLSFVGGLADLARATYEANLGAGENPLVSSTGGIFPFVADAIFGTLDDSFRREVSRLLPELAPQVILFLSKAQSSGEVREQLQPRIGAVAVIEAEMARTDVEAESITFDGREFAYVTPAGGGDDKSTLTMIQKPKVSS